MKRFICLLLACLLIAPAALATDYSTYTNAELAELIASAQNELTLRFDTAHPTDASEFLYGSNGKEIRINSFVGNSTNVVIPSEIDGLPVTLLHTGAFENNDNIESVYIPDSITLIPRETFQNSDRITHVRLPKTLITIGTCAFYECDLKEVIILPETLEEISYDAFGWTHATGVIFNSDVICTDTSYAFAFMNQLEFIYIKEGCNPTFGRQEFYDCPAIKIAIIPASVTFLPDTIFSDSKLLKFITPAGSYAESFAMEHFIPVETDTYDEYVALYDSMYPDL